MSESCSTESTFVAKAPAEEQTAQRKKSNRAGFGNHFRGENDVIEEEHAWGVLSPNSEVER